MKSFIAALAAAATVLLLSSCSSPESDGHADHQNGPNPSCLMVVSAVRKHLTALLKSHDGFVEKSHDRH